MANDLVPINEVTTTLAVRAVDLNVKQVFGQIQEYIKELKGEWMYAQMQMGDTAKQVNARVIDVKNTFKEQAEEQMEGMSGIKDGMQDWIDSLDNLGDGLDSGTSKSRRMTMALLSVMFFGMMLQRTFMGLLQPAADVFGIFDLWSTTLMVIFIPVMELLMPLFISLVQWLMEMPEGLKLAMGLFTLLGVVVGTILMTIGQFGLGLTGLTEFFPKMVEGVKVLESFATKWGNKAIGIGFAYLGISNLLDKDKKDPFLGLAELAVSAGMLTGSKATKKIAGAFAVGMIAFEIMSDAVNGEVISFKTAMELAMTAAFASSFMGFGKAGPILTFSAVIVLSWLLPKIPEFLEKTGLRQMARNLGKEIGKNVKRGRAGEEPEPITWDKLIAKPKPVEWRETEEEDDFIWRPGQKPISISPNDNLVGFKGNNPMGGSVVINQTINANVSDIKELERLLAENNRNLVSQISSQFNVARG